MLSVNKKGLEAHWLVSILLLIVGAIMFMFVLGEQSARADEKAQELLCRGFNSIRSATEVELPFKGKTGTPRACNTIHKTGKKEIPSKDSIKIANNDLKQAALYEIRDLAARCWYMWLEGKDKDMFNKKWSDWGGDPGFVCYTFTINSKLKEITSEEFIGSLSAPYYAIDTSDKCGARGGGKCSRDCSAISDGGILWEEFQSDKCISGTVTGTRVEGGRGELGGGGAGGTYEGSGNIPGIKCCIPKDTRYECVSKGGTCVKGGSCSDLEPKGSWEQVDQWSCPDDKVIGPTGKRCCVKIENKVSYLDYIQGTNGADTGPGALILPQNLKFVPGKRYAINFISPGEWFDLRSLGWLAGSLGTSALTVAAYLPPVVAFTGGLSVQASFVTGGVTFYLWDQFLQAGSIDKINYISISEYDSVKNKFAESTLPKGD